MFTAFERPLLALKLMAGVINMLRPVRVLELESGRWRDGRMVGITMFWFVLADCKLPVVVKLELATLVPLTVTLETL